MDRDLLARAYDRTAAIYDEQFRAQQREKYRAAARLLQAEALPPGPVLDAGGGTALFAEWLADPSEPSPAVREEIRARKLLVLDASLGMLRRAASRACFPIAGDLQQPPFGARFALVVAFTSILGDTLAGVRALGCVLAPSGLLALTLLSREALPAARLARAAGLRHLAGPAPAGRDRAFLLRSG